MRLLLAALLLLWLQLFWTLVPTWRFGEYYAYGWFVPLLAAGLAWRRWRLIDTSAMARTVPGWLLAVTLLAVLCLAPLRLIAIADPFWRPPILLHALMVFGLTHLLLWKLLSRRISLFLLPVSVFALSAVPYPWQFEQELIGTLTGWVVSITHELFLLAGRPVELSGERLVLGSEVVAVTEGCSGIRSLQSLVMVALFFGELLWLDWGKRLGLLLVAAACAVAINTMRAVWLAEIHFTRGQAAADAAHDSIGHLSFALSAALLWLSAFLLLHLGEKQPQILRRTQVATTT